MNVFLFTVRRSQKAGVTFPVGRIERHLRKGKYASRISSSASVYMAAALEYLSAEVLELSGIATQQNGKKRIQFTY